HARGQTSKKPFPLSRLRPARLEFASYPAPHRRRTVTYLQVVGRPVGTHAAGSEILGTSRRRHPRHVSRLLHRSASRPDPDVARRGRGGSCTTARTQG